LARTSSAGTSTSTLTVFSPIFFNSAINTYSGIFARGGTRTRTACATGS
jgi:hypothetical protein